MAIRLKIASEKNLADLLPLVRAYHEFEGIDISDATREAAVKKLLLSRSLGAIWLLYQEDQLVGYIALCVGFSIEFAGFDAFLDEFYILPEFRGKGIGTKALGLVKIEAKKMDIHAIHLEVARSNTSAQALYSRENFIAREKYVLMSVTLL